MNRTLSSRDGTDAQSKSTPKSWRPRLASLVLVFALVGGVSLAAPPAAVADTAGYGRLTVDRFMKPQFEFGIPAWVTSNYATRTGAKGACAAYLGHALKLKWFLWWAPDAVCGMVVDRFWSPYNGRAVCGIIPLGNVMNTRLWSC